jgi:MFS family permease
MVVGPAIGALAAQVGRGPVFTAIALVLALLALAGPAAAPASSRTHGSVQALWRLLRSRRAAFGNSLLFVIGIVGGTVASLMPLLVANRRGGAATIAAIFALGYLLAALLNVFIGRLSDRFGRQVPTLVGMAIAAALLPSLPFFGSLIGLAIVAVIAQSAISALWTPTAAMVSDGADSGATGQAVGVATMNAAWAAGGAGGPVLAAWLAAATGFVWPFALAGALCAVSAVALLVGYGRRDERQQAPEAASTAD